MNSIHKFVITLIVLFLNLITRTTFAQIIDPPNFDNDVLILPFSNTGNTSFSTCNSCDIGNMRFWPATNIPGANSIVKIIKVDFNILQNGSGGGNFINDPVDLQNGTTRLNNMLNWINDHYSRNNIIFPNNMPPANVIVNDLPNEFIQFDLGNIYFYDDAIYWKSTDYNSLLNLVKNDPNRNPNSVDGELQAFFSEGWYNALPSHITISNGGSGYTSPPNISFASPCDAQAIAQITGGVVTDITITYSGTIRYSSTNNPATNYGVPAITISGGGGTGATAFINKMSSGAAAFASLPSCSLINPVFLVAFGAWHGDLFPDHTVGDFASSTVLAHELGHNLDLIHTYNGANCTTNSSDPTYMDDIYGLPAPGNCPHNVSWDCSQLSISNKIDNNMLGGNQCAGYFSPKQIGYMHRALRFKSIRKYLKQCYYDNLNPVVINSTEIWDFDIQNDADIIINASASMQIDCKVSMPQGSKIIVKSGGTLIVNGIVTNYCDGGWDGSIEVKPGGILKLFTGADITFKGNGKILIDDDPTNPGKLVFEQNAKVYLDSYTSSIEINGDLEIGNNATFAFQHHNSQHGFIRFGNASHYPSRNITAGVSSSINIIGSSSNQKVLQIDQETFYAPANLLNFNISNGKVVFNSNSRMQADGLSTNINFNNVKFTSNIFGQNNGHRGVHLYGQPNISITGCIFEYGRYGIFAYLTYGGAPLNIYGSVFRNNTFGILAHDKGLNLFQCSFFNNYYGVYGGQMSFPSTFTEGYTGGGIANGNTNGIRWQGNSTPSLTLDDPYINSNNIGVRVDNCPLNVKCGSVSFNQTGIAFNYGANLFMDDQVATPNTASVTAFNNVNSIRTIKGWYMWLNKGYNDLSPSSLFSQRTANGILLSPPYTIVANVNRWNSLGTFSSLDYNLTDPIGNPYTISDLYPLSTPAACGQAIPACPTLPCAYESPLENCPTCDVINTDDFSALKLNLATKEAIEKTNSNDQNKYKDAAYLFYQILNENYTNPDNPEKYLLSLTYIKMMDALGNAFKNGELICSEMDVPEIVTNIISIQDKFIDQAIMDNNYDFRFKYSMDKAQTLRIACRRDACLDLLATISTWNEGDDNINAVNRFMCDVNLEIQVLNGSVLPENIEEVTTICNSGNEKRRNEEVSFSFDAPSIDLDVYIFNNMTTNMVEVKTNAEIAHLIMLNAIGEYVFEKEINYDCSIDANLLSKGLYLIKVTDSKTHEIVTNKLILR